MNTPREVEVARKFHRKAERLRKTGTAKEVVGCYQQGLAVVPGDAELQYLFGHALYWGMGVPQNHTKAAEWLRRAADQNHAEALDTLGVMYQLGAGVPTSGTHAAELFGRSAALGDTWAMGKLGLMYLEGQGVPQDLVEACFWYTVTCECVSNPYDAFEAAKCRDRIASRLTDAEISTVRNRAREWLNRHPFGTIL